MAASVAGMDRAHILNGIQRNDQAEDSRDDEETMSVLELGVNCGTARYERHTESVTSLINQYRTETGSRRVLANMLKIICTCSTCNDDDLSTN